jgi:hypothetical protein
MALIFETCEADEYADTMFDKLLREAEWLYLQMPADKPESPPQFLR